MIKGIEISVSKFIFVINYKNISKKLWKHLGFHNSHESFELIYNNFFKFLITEMKKKGIILYVL